ncbi:SCAN domain-containing protein 3-like [Haliotis rufescens]|uniref:SCAN domain-containing protein 3-like n=1 Tax=Haliotis rufescens TaxID=6454 RepID=UPI00201F6C6D|nr:SCAN domain-containing protein 3-like [Haliotis rufescens]
MSGKSRVTPSSSSRQKELESYYFNPKSPGAYYGASKFQQSLKRRGKTVSVSKVKTELNKHDAYTLHKTVKRKFQRLRVLVNRIDQQWDVDLMDMSRYVKVNDGIRYVLIAIDILSRYLWVAPLKNKKPESTVEAFKDIWSHGRKPQTIRVDKGTEFKGAFQDFIERQSIKLFVTQNEDIKANYAERVIRTLRSLIARYLTHKNTERYVDVLSDLVYNYNHTVHRSLGEWAPADVNERNEVKVWNHLYTKPSPYMTHKIRPFQYKIGNIVRINYLRKPFAKEHNLRWTEELFKVAARYRRQGIPLYTLKDFHDQFLKGRFYEEELQRVDKDLDAAWDIEKVLKKKKDKGKLYYLVRWAGWPSSFDSWVEASEVKDK